MYKLTCSDLGTPECHFAAEGNTPDEAMQKMKEHAIVVHADKVKDMPAEELEKMMKEKMKML